MKAMGFDSITCRMSSCGFSFAWRRTACACSMRTLRSSSVAAWILQRSLPVSGSCLTPLALQGKPTLVVPSQRVCFATLRRRSLGLSAGPVLFPDPLPVLQPLTAAGR
jgi:hypothetical protein